MIGGQSHHKRRDDLEKEEAEGEENVEERSERLSFDEELQISKSFIQVSANKSALRY